MKAPGNHVPGKNAWANVPKPGTKSPTADARKAAKATISVANLQKRKRNTSAVLESHIVGIEEAGVAEQAGPREKQDRGKELPENDSLGG